MVPVALAVWIVPPVALDSVTVKVSSVHHHVRCAVAVREVLDAVARRVAHGQNAEGWEQSLPAAANSLWVANARRTLRAATRSS